MSTANLLQSKGIVSGTQGSTVTSATVTLDEPAIAGNLLVACLAVDKNSGTIPIPSGWTAGPSIHVSTDISGTILYRVAEGGETGLTMTWATPREFARLWLGEIADAPEAAYDTGSHGDSGTNNVLTQSAGEVAPSATPAFAVAFAAMDSSFEANTHTDWSGGVSLVYDSSRARIGTAQGHPVLTVAFADLPEASPINPTATWPAGADQAMAQVAVFTYEAEEPEGLSVTSAVVGSDGLSVAITFSEAVLPASGITGFAATVAGSARSLTVARTAPNTITLTLASPAYAGQTVVVSYADGNVTSEGSEPLGEFSRTATNNSTVPAPPTVDWRWSGAVTATSASVVAKLSGSATAARLNVYDETGSTLVVQSGSASGSRVRLDVTGLSPSTAYLGRIECDGVEDASKPVRFTTFPVAGTPATFQFGFASCADTGTTSSVFTRIRNRNPRFFCHLGDLHYRDIATNNIANFRVGYDGAVGAANQAALFADVATDYIWDDHDYGPNNSDATSPSRPASCAAYRENVPHYPLPSTNDAIYHSFVFGRVRFVVTDLRSERAVHTAPDDSSKTVMSQEQEDWFLGELAAAKAAGQAVLWANTFPWIGTTGDDGWHKFTVARQYFADQIKALGMQGRIAIISGDAHMLAADDGTNSDYATGGGMPMPVCHAAAMDRSHSVKGGPYSHGNTTSGTGHYGIMTVTDEGGDEIAFAFRGYNGSDAVAISMDFTLQASIEPPGGIDGETAQAIIDAIKAELPGLVRAELAVELARIDAPITSRSTLTSIGVWSHDDRALTDRTGFGLAPTGLDAIPLTPPGGVATNFREMLVQTWRRFFGPATKTGNLLQTLGDDGETVLTSQAIADDGETEFQGPAL